MVVGISGRTFDIRKNVSSQQKTGHSKNEVVVGISGQTLIIEKKIQSEKNGSFENFGGSRNFRSNVRNPEKR